MDDCLREDFVFLRRMRQPDFGVLVDLSDEEIRKVAADRGTTRVDCPDADQNEDLSGMHKRVCGIHRHHPLALNGGALLLSLKGPEEFHARGQILLEDAVDGCDMKEINTLVLYGHWPCGKALKFNIRIDRACELYVDGKQRAREFFRERNMPLAACCLWIHVDWPKELKSSKNTYFFKREAWERPNVRGFRDRWRNEPSFRKKCVKQYWNDQKFWQKAA